MIAVAFKDWLMETKVSVIKYFDYSSLKTYIFAYPFAKIHVENTESMSLAYCICVKPV